MNDQLTIKHIIVMTHMGWAITICRDNTGAHVHHIMCHDGFDTEINVTGNDINDLIFKVYNRIIKFNY